MCFQIHNLTYSLTKLYSSFLFSNLNIKILAIEFELITHRNKFWDCCVHHFHQASMFTIGLEPITHTNRFYILNLTQEHVHVLFLMLLQLALQSIIYQLVSQKYNVHLFSSSIAFLKACWFFLVILDKYMTCTL